jgi:hypothetical protein
MALEPGSELLAYSIEPIWRHREEGAAGYDNWKWLRSVCHGAALAFPHGSEDQEDCYLLRDIAIIHQQECKSYD